jgi:hypothetical protein
MAYEIKGNLRMEAVQCVETLYLAARYHVPDSRNLDRL